MPRIHIYANQRTIDGIRTIVDEMRADGATTSEVNMSSVAAELLEIGLRVKGMKKNNDADSVSQEDIYREGLLEECVKSRLASQEILTLMFDLQDIKSNSRNNYNKQISVLKEKTNLRIRALLGKE